MWNRWGRVGERGQFKQAGPMAIDRAIKDFEKKFKDKTGNEWKKRANFTPKTGKYTVDDILFMLIQLQQPSLTSPSRAPS